MRGLGWFSLAFLFFAANAYADALPSGFVENHLNGSEPPLTEDGVTTFTVREGECSEVDYGNGTGENDCLNGSVKSQIVQSARAGLGDTLTYAFDILVPADFSYAGEYIAQSVPFRAEGWDSKLRIAGWEGPFPKNFIYMLKLDSTKGLTFLGNSCQSPEAFGTWVSFKLQVRWANDDKGWVKATCDDRIVYADEGAPSTAQVQCYQANECDPGVTRDPREILFSLGPAVNGAGFQWKEMKLATPFTDLPEEGVTVQMRNISVTSGAELYDAAAKDMVSTLQSALNTLGCDVGTPDGIVGPRTRAQAVACRTFPEGEMPEKLTVASLAKFVDLYTSAGVADLPEGKAAADPATGLLAAGKRVRAVVEEENFQNEVRVNSTIMGTVEGSTFGKFDVLLEGMYNVPKDEMMSLSMRFSDDLGKDAPDLSSCGGQVVFDSFGSHVQVRFKLSPEGDYILPAGDCFRDAIPGPVGQKVEYFLSNFSDVAVGLVADETYIAHQGLKSFLTKIANGTVSVVN